MSSPSPYRGSISPACPSYPSGGTNGATFSNSSFFSQSSSSGGSYRKKNFIANLISKGSGSVGRRDSEGHETNPPSSAALLSNRPPRNEPTPLPVKKLICVLAVFFAESMSIVRVLIC